MTDKEEYIRKAVELAEGLTFRNASAWYEIKRDYPKAYLDALAAQLVRQVDATGNDVWTDKEYVSVRGQSANFVRVKGPDRTMNIIQAIVDSGVLE